eukprot:Transcript_10531.p1 GENE.Transcript_10531~~Transcript_10531.p1  ORF type:complete len:313 (-),score=99.40 Transcript_10531:60-914(-)
MASFDSMALIEKQCLEKLRTGLDITARKAKAAESKAEANELFAAGDSRSAVISYLAGIWFLKRGAELPCPAVIVSRSEALDGAVDALGDGDFETEAEEADGAAALRLTLHLNLAAAALKLEEFELARMACEYIFEKQGFDAPAKAFYRLAKAHAGEGSLLEARALLERLLVTEPRNVEAADLLAEVRGREAKLSTPKIEHLRERVEAAGAAARPPVDPERMTGADFARLSCEEQEAMVEQISRALDEPASGGDDDGLDMQAILRALKNTGGKHAQQTATAKYPP